MAHLDDFSNQIMTMILVKEHEVPLGELFMNILELFINYSWNVHMTGSWTIVHEQLTIQVHEWLNNISWIWKGSRTIHKVLLLDLHRSNSNLSNIQISISIWLLYCISVYFLNRYWDSIYWYRIIDLINGLCLKKNTYRV